MSEEARVVRLLDQLTLCHPMTFCTTVSMAFLWFLSAMPTLSPAFLAPDDNNTNQDDFNSVQLEFGLDSPAGLLHPAELTSSVFFLGNLLLGQLPCVIADSIGRRSVIVFCVFTNGLVGVLAAFAPSFLLLLVARFVQGMAFSAMIMINWVLCCESLAPSAHKIAAMMFGTLWVAGYIAMAPIGKYCISWRQIQFISSLPSLIFAFFLLWSLPESPAFLASQGNRNELKKFIARANKKKKKPIKCDVDELIDSLGTNSGKPISTIVYDIFHSRSTLLHLFAAIILWICDFLMYGCMALTATNVGKDPYISFMFSGLAEWPCYIVIPYLLDWFGRKPTVIGIHLLCAASFTLLLVYPAESIFWFWIWLVGKFGVSSAFQCCFIYGVEIFPVENRNICLGICSTLANLGAFFSAHVDILDDFYPGGSYMTFFILCVLCCGCTLTLPETKLTNKSIHL